MMLVDFSFLFHFKIKTSGTKFGWNQFSLEWSRKGLRRIEGMKGGRGGELKT